MDVRLALDAELLEDRHQLLAEAAERLFGLPDVDDAKALLALSGHVREQTLDVPPRKHTPLHRAVRTRPVPGK